MGSSKSSPNGANLLLGRGALYIDRLTSGVSTGERHVGNVTLLEIGQTATTKEKFESMTPSAGLLASVNTQLKSSLKFTGDEFTLENLAMALFGDQAKVSQTGASIADGSEIITAASVQGRWFRTKYRKISAVTVKFGATYAGAETATVDDDYTVDANSGRIYIVPGGAITDGSKAYCDYTYATISLDSIQGGKEANIQAYVRFVGSPLEGPIYEAEFWKVQLSPNGQVGLITDDFGNWTLDGLVLADLANHPSEPYYRIMDIG